MRNLTIKRVKSFVGCVAKALVYVEDPFSTEIEIRGIPCRKLGELKNGEEKTFQIGNAGVKVFIIADKFSKEFCNEYYNVLAGEEDVYLSGKNKFNPAVGNAFRFDNNNDPEVIANYKKNASKGLGILILSMIIGFVFGYLFVSAIL